MKKLLSDLPNILKLTYQGWTEDKASRLAAALAYYTIFSLAPLLIIVIAIAGLLWHQSDVRSQLLNQIQGLVGAEGAKFLSDLITSASNPAKGITATIFGIITLLLGALAVFNELHNSLNTIWGVEEERPRGFLQSIKKIIVDRFLSFAMILGIGFLLLVSLVVSTVLSGAQQTIGNMLPMSEFILQIVNLVISIGVITVLFAMIYKFLPDIEIAWGDVWIGAFATAVFFSLGKFAIGLYLGNSAIASSFGAAGSLVILLVWIYYSAQILFFGAEFTEVYANKYGSKIVSEEDERVGQPESRVTKDLRRQRAVPATFAIWKGESRFERRNRQTARIFVGLMAASFFTGILTTIVGLKRK
jgi:membrane protein